MAENKEGIRIHHFIGAATLAAEAVDDDHCFVGLALCAPGENYNRKIGRTIAEGRIDDFAGRSIRGKPTREDQLVTIVPKERIRSAIASARYMERLGDLTVDVKALLLEKLFPRHAVRFKSRLFDEWKAERKKRDERLSASGAYLCVRHAVTKPEEAAL